MKWIRSFVPTGLFVLGLASTTTVGIALAQDEEEKKADQPRPAATQKSAPKATTTNKAPAAAAKDAIKDAKEDAKDDAREAGKDEAKATATEKQAKAALGAKYEAEGETLSVTTVEQTGILGQAGLRAKDRIISIDGRPFKNPRHIDAYLWAQSGRMVPVIIERGGQRYTVTANIPQHGATSGWLGVYLDEGDADTQGARVTQVYPTSPASRAGLHVGDVITQIDDQKIEGSAEAVMLIRDFQPQAQVNFVVSRNNEEMKIPVTIGSRQDFAGGFQGGQQNERYQSNYQGQGNDDNQQFSGVPPYAMQLEQDRRNAEQHERIEDEIRLLREEIKQLRELLEKK